MLSTQASVFPWTKKHGTLAIKWASDFAFLRLDKLKTVLVSFYNDWLLAILYRKKKTWQKSLDEEMLLLGKTYVDMQDRESWAEFLRDTDLLASKAIRKKTTMTPPVGLPSFTIRSFSSK